MCLIARKPFIKYRYTASVLFVIGMFHGQDTDLQNLNVSAKLQGYFYTCFIYDQDEAETLHTKIENYQLVSGVQDLSRVSLFCYTDKQENSN